MCQRVLIIEDEEHVRETLALLLEDAGFMVRSCATGKNIFNTIDEFYPDLILLDIMLEDLDGRDICRALKQNPRTSSIPVVILSAVSEIYNTISEVGANDIVAKPFDERTLLNRINRQLSNSALH